MMDSVVARTPKPRAHLKGETPNHVNSLLNKALDNMSLNLKDCEDFSIEDLNRIHKEIACHHHDHFNDIYVENNDNRKRRMLIEEYEETWKVENYKLEKTQNFSKSSSMENVLKLSCTLFTI